jgi:hypothetical protein
MISFYASGVNNWGLVDFVGITHHLMVLHWLGSHIKWDHSQASHTMIFGIVVSTLRMNVYTWVQSPCDTLYLDMFCLINVFHLDVPMCCFNMLSSGVLKQCLNVVFPVVFQVLFQSGVSKKCSTMVFPLLAQPGWWEAVSMWLYLLSGTGVAGLTFTDTVFVTRWTVDTRRQCGLYSVSQTALGSEMWNTK